MRRRPLGTVNANALCISKRATSGSTSNRSQAHALDDDLNRPLRPFFGELVRLRVLSQLVLSVLFLNVGSSRAQNPPPLRGTWTGGAHAPTGIAADDSGYVYVADFDNSLIIKYTGVGEFIREWGGDGSAPGQLHWPTTGLAIDHSGHIYVSDHGNSRIQKFTTNGTLMAVWPYGGARGICVDFDGHVYLSGGNAIRVLNSEGELVATWTSLGAGKGLLGQTNGVTSDLNGNIYVADVGAKRIVKFSHSGGYLADWPNDAGEGIFFVSVTGMATDALGNLYVANQGSHRMQVFTPNLGQPLVSWGSTDGNPGPLWSPQGVALDPSGNIFVADQGFHRIQSFAPFVDTVGFAVLTPVVGRGIVLRSRDKAAYPLGSPLQLMARALPGDRFLSWSGDTTATRDTLDLLVTTSRALIANFDRDPAASPSLGPVADVPDDQGGFVELAWTRSAVDIADYLGALCCYQVERAALDPPQSAWELVATVNATTASGYAYVLSTPADSTPLNPGRWRYRVAAAAFGDTARWVSNEMVGASVDNIAPPAPASVSGAIASGVASLYWGNVSAPDFSHFAIYRSTELPVPVDAAHRVATTATPGHVDVPGYFANYCVSSVDVHGTESVGTPFVPANPAGVDDPAIPQHLAVLNRSPVSMREGARFRLGLPIAGEIKAELFDAQGRIAGTLVDGSHPAGWLTVVWDAREGDTRASAPGLYFLRVRLGRESVLRRIVLLP